MIELVRLIKAPTMSILLVGGEIHIIFNWVINMYIKVSLIGFWCKFDQSTIVC